MWVRATLDVEGLSALNAAFVYGHPGPSAFVGFAHALCAQAGLRGQPGVLAVFHEFEPRAVNVKGALQYAIQRSSIRDVGGSVQIDLPRADARVSVIFACKGGDDAHERLDTTLDEMRFAGGVITGWRLSVHGGFAEAQRAMPFGFVMKEGEHEAGAEPIDSLPGLVDRLAQGPNAMPGSGWHTASLLGYRLLEDPWDRPGARGQRPHAYADPLVGIVRFESKRRATQDDLWCVVRRARLIRYTTRMETWA